MLRRKVGWRDATPRTPACACHCAADLMKQCLYTAELGLQIFPVFAWYSYSCACVVVAVAVGVNRAIVIFRMNSIGGFENRPLGQSMRFRWWMVCTQIRVCSRCIWSALRKAMDKIPPLLLLCDNEANTCAGSRHRAWIIYTMGRRLTDTCLARNSLITLDFSLPARIAGFVLASLSLAAQNVVHLLSVSLRGVQGV
jgi:hypothetical protein